MPPWDIPVFRSAYFPKRVHRTLFSKTHDLQVRFAHPPSPHRNLLSEGSGVPHGLFCNSAPSPIRALVFRSAYSASRNARASAAFAASIEAHRAVSSETLMLQPLRGLRTPHRPPVSLCFSGRFFPSPRRTSFSSCSGVPHGLFCAEVPPGLLLQNAHAPGSLRSPSEPRTVLPFLCAFLQNARPPGSLRSPSELRTALPFLCAFLVGLFSVSAPKPSFRRFRCSAWLIQLRQRTALSPLKRSCFRFAALTLRCRTPLSCPSRTDLSSVQKTPHLFSVGPTGGSRARTILFPLPG